MLRIQGLLIKSIRSCSILINSTHCNQILSVPHTFEKQEDFEAYKKTLILPKKYAVTKILNETKPAESVLALERWQEEMIKKLGPEKFDEKRKRYFSDGKSLHNSIRQLLLGVPEYQIAIPKNIAGFWKSILPHLKQMDNAMCIEQFLVHPLLGYGGKIDCIGCFNNSELCLIDWKTSDQRKKTLDDTFEYPTQVAAYVGLVNVAKYCDTEVSDKVRNILANVTVKRATLMVCYDSGRIGDVIWLENEDLQIHWVDWLLRLKEFYEINSKVGE